MVRRALVTRFCVVGTRVKFLLPIAKDVADRLIETDKVKKSKRSAARGAQDRTKNQFWYYRSNTMSETKDILRVFCVLLRCQKLIFIQGLYVNMCKV